MPLFKQQSVPSLLFMGQTSWLMKGIHLQKKSVQDHQISTLTSQPSSWWCALWCAAEVELWVLWVGTALTMCRSLLMKGRVDNEPARLLGWPVLCWNLLEKENKTLLEKEASFGAVGVKGATRVGLGLMGESAVGAGEVEIDWEALKNASLVLLPMGWGAGGRWRYAEGSRNIIEREEWARVRTRRRNGVGLGKAVLVSGRPRRVRSGVSAPTWDELQRGRALLCASTQASRSHQPRWVSCMFSGGLLGESIMNLSVSHTSASTQRFVGSLFSLLATFQLNKVASLLCFPAWRDGL